MSAPPTELELRSQIATTLSNAGAFCGHCGFEPGDRGKCADCERCWSSYADALIPTFATALANARAQALAEQAAEVERLRTLEAAVTEFVAARAEYITSIENCHPDNARDYYRWQGHAESRRQLAQKLDLPVAWPAEGGEGR